MLHIDIHQVHIERAASLGFHMAASELVRFADEKLLKKNLSVLILGVTQCQKKLVSKMENRSGHACTSPPDHQTHINAQQNYILTEIIAITTAQAECR